MDERQVSYPGWMKRWNDWAYRTDGQILTFFEDLGQQTSEALVDLRYKADRLLFSSAKDDQVGTAVATGRGNYEFWRHSLDGEGSPKVSETSKLPEDRW